MGGGGEAAVLRARCFSARARRRVRVLSSPAPPAARAPRRVSREPLTSRSHAPTRTRDMVAPIGSGVTLPGLSCPALEVARFHVINVASAYALRTKSRHKLLMKQGSSGDHIVATRGRSMSRCNVL